MNSRCHGGSGTGKRKRGERVFGFMNFCHPGHPTNFDGTSFSQNMQSLLRFGHVDHQTDSSIGLKTWSFRLEVCQQPALHLSLIIVEESVPVLDNSANLQYCRHCRCVGWGSPRLICHRKYHLVVPSKETRKDVIGGSSSNPTQKQNLLEVRSHLMHGVFHSNGFGHLLCINGFETCPRIVTGSQIMELWDRICSGLRARKVSLTDNARKRSMELRLIHSVAYGEHWFGRWGYRFERGTYGVTQQLHQKAIDALRTISMSAIIHHYRTSCNINPDINIILTIFSRYQAVSGYTLQTLGHLFHFMLELKIRLPLESLTACRREGGGAGCRWSSKRVEMATRVIIESLKRAKPRWVSRQQVRDVARVSVGDTGLLDFVLKSLSNHVVGKYMVRRTLNPVTKVLEYCLEDISNLYPAGSHAQEGSSSSSSSSNNSTTYYNAKTKSRFYINRAQLLKDIYKLYKYLLIRRNRSDGVLNDGIVAGIQAVARVILDGKHLAKEYYTLLADDPPRQTGIFLTEENHDLKLLCTIWLIDDQEEVGIYIRNWVMPPHELIVIPVHATIKELKREVERCFRETYWSLRTFVAESIVEIMNHGTHIDQDSDLVCGLMESGSRVVVAGRIVHEAKGAQEVINSDYKYWVVDCHCGAKEDDGEAMISCYICDVWQHNRCVQVAENVSDPIFICSRCETSISALS